VKESISQTLKNFKDPDSELGICFGTVRLKTGQGEVVGTVRVKEGEKEGTIRYVGTVKFKDGKELIDNESEAPDWANFGFQSVRIVRDEIDYGTVKCSAIRDDVAFVYRPPEPWEISILALEKGEYNPEMKEEAFGKYKKKRQALRGVNDLFIQSTKTSDKSPTLKRSVTDPVKQKNEVQNLQDLLGDFYDLPTTGSKSHLRDEGSKTEFKRYGSTGVRKHVVAHCIQDTNSTSPPSSSPSTPNTTPTSSLSFSLSVKSSPNSTLSPTTNSQNLELKSSESKDISNSGKERAWAKWRKDNTDI